MAVTLPVSRLVQVAVNLSPLPAAGRNFGDLLLLGDSNVISGLERIRDYTDLAGVESDFGVDAPESAAATVYFGQSPKPENLSIGRWLRTASAAQLDGQILTSAQQTLANFTMITSGGFDITVDGTVHLVTGLDFSTALNLNGVASVVNTAITAYASCVFTGSEFVITSNYLGAGVKATATINFTGNPANNDTITVNGTVITFVTASPTGNQVLIGGSGNLTAVNLNTFLNASVITGVALASYSVAAGVITVTYKTVGSAGNAFTLAESATNVTVSSGTLLLGHNASSVSYATSPASGQDVSTLLGLTSAVALPLVPGYDAESALAAVSALSSISNRWYGLHFASSVMPSKSDNLAIAAFIEASSVTRLFGVTITDTDVLSSVVTDDLASQLKAGGYEQSFCQYSSSNPYAACSMFGRAFSVNFEAANTTITLMYKQEPGIVAENLTTTQANVLQTKRCNVYAAYANDTSIIQYGVVSGPAFFDEIHGLDWFADAIQTACFNVNYTSDTKVPQTDQGQNQFVTAIANVCDQAITNGLAAPGTWNAAGFGELLQGQYLKTGYYIFAQSIALQAESDRAARNAPPIQVALKLAGAIQDVDVLVSVNR